MNFASLDLTVFSSYFLGVIQKTEMSTHVSKYSYNSIHLKLIKFRQETYQSPYQLSEQVYVKLKSNDMLKEESHGTIGEINKISVITSHSRKYNKKSKSSINPKNLLNINLDNFSNADILLNISLVNLRSLRNKSVVFREYVEDNSLDLCICTETWLSDNDVVIATEATPPSYSLLCANRSGRTGGGTALLCHDDLKPILTKSGSHSSFEFSEYLIKQGRQFVKIVIIYRPPYSPNNPFTISTFLEEFQNYLLEVTATTNNLLISGDFNIHVNDAGDRNAVNFLQLLDHFGLENNVHIPTHVSKNTLDLIITRKKSENDVALSEIRAGTFISDHCFITSLMRPGIPKRNSIQEIKYRNIKSIDIDKLNAEIRSSELFQPHWHEQSVDLLAQSFDKTLSGIFDKCAPQKTKVIRARNSPWYTQNLKNLKIEKRKKERKWLRTGSLTDFHSFKIASKTYYEHCMRSS